MPFDRHAILERHYIEALRHEYKWDAIRQECERNAEPSDDDADSSIGYCWLGSVYGCTPSGKVYAFWTSNQTRHDEQRDAAWWDALEQVASDAGLFVGGPDCADGDGVYVGVCLDRVTE